MKKQLITFMMVFLMAVSSAFAKEQSVKIVVKGMVCGFCAQGIEKKFKVLDSVEKVSVSLKEKVVTVGIKDGRTVADDEIKKILNDSGYNVEKIERD